MLGSTSQYHFCPWHNRLRQLPEVIDHRLSVDSGSHLVEAVEYDEESSHAIQVLEGSVSRQIELVLAKEEVGEQRLDAYGLRIVAQGDYDGESRPGEASNLRIPVFFGKSPSVVQAEPRLPRPELAQNREVLLSGVVQPRVDVAVYPAALLVVSRYKNQAAYLAS